MQERRLFKRALDLPASDVPSDTQPWVSDDAGLLERVEDALARETGLLPGQAAARFPGRGLDAGGGPAAPLTRSGAVDRLTDAGRAGQLGLPRVADELYRSARRLRVFTDGRRPARLDGLMDVVTMPAADLAARLQAGTPLLG